MKKTLFLRFLAMLVMMVTAGMYYAWIVSWMAAKTQSASSSAISEMIWQNLPGFMLVILLGGVIGFMYGWRALKPTTNTLHMLGISLLASLLFYASMVALFFGFSFIHASPDAAEGQGFLVYLSILGILPTLVYFIRLSAINS